MFCGVRKGDCDALTRCLWHSSAHVLGEVLERLYGSDLNGAMWRMNRFRGGCGVEGKMMFLHSLAHMLGEVLKRLYSSYLTTGRV